MDNNLHRAAMQEITEWGRGEWMMFFNIFVT